MEAPETDYCFVLDAYDQKVKELTRFVLGGMGVSALAPALAITYAISPWAYDQGAGLVFLVGIFLFIEIVGRVVRYLRIDKSLREREMAVIREVDRSVNRIRDSTRLGGSSVERDRKIAT